MIVLLLMTASAFAHHDRPPFALRVVAKALISTSRHVWDAPSIACIHSWQSLTDVARKVTASPPRG